MGKGHQKTPSRACILCSYSVVKMGCIKCMNRKSGFFGELRSKRETCDKWTDEKLPRWKCDPKNREACLNCRYKDCIKA